ncbi:hypothetical protein KGQ24_03240 [Patescibacteria group bacterium]|nr:hypothetical protein [Patescibacteria group bacterium]
MTQENKGINPPKDLLPKVLSRIQREKQLRTMKRNLAFSASVFVFFSILGYALSPYIARDSQLSEFSKFFGLIFTDFRDVIAHWNLYGQSLLESVPAFAFAILLSLSLAIIVTLLNLLRQIKAFKKISRINN